MNPGVISTIPPGPWGGNQTQTTASIASEIAAQVAKQTPPMILQSAPSITIEAPPLGREGQEEVMAMGVRGVKDALWAHDQDLEDLISRIPNRAGA